MSLSCTTCDGRFTPVSPPVNSFLFSFFSPVLPRVQPYCYRVESRATTLVLITIRIYEALSLRQPNLVPISHRIPPISIYVARIVSRPNRGFSLHSVSRSVTTAWEKRGCIYVLYSLCTKCAPLCIYTG